MKKKLIIFDMDGVLFDSCKLVNDFFLNMYPTMTQDEMNEILSGNFHEGLEKFKLNNNPIMETQEEKEDRQRVYSTEKKKTLLFAGIMDLLQILHSSGFVLAINTSALGINCIPLLENSDIKDLFDFVATAEVSRSKVEKFKAIEDKYKIPKKDIIFITDTLGDIREADISGISTIAVTWGAHSRSFFENKDCKNIVKIVDTVVDLKNYLLEWSVV